MWFKLPNIEEYLRGALTRTVACEFKQYCGDNAESMLKAITPHNIYSCIFKQRPSPRSRIVVSFLDELFARRMQTWKKP
jgi:hypothetical protein